MSLLYHSAVFVRQANQLVSDDAALEHLVSRHAPLFQGTRADELLRAVVADQQGSSEAAVHLANAYANPQPERLQPSAGLLPIFQQVEVTGSGHDSGTYTPRAFAEGVAYPDKSPPAYGDLARLFDSRLSALAARRPDSGALLANLSGFLHEVAWCVPVSGAAVSLYDHARLAAAIAGVFGALMTQSRPIDDERRALFMLVVGDVSGIQNHIYRIRSSPTGTGALAKRLRARSLEVALSTEAMGRDILRALKLPLTQRIMGAGGKFYLLLPNDDATLGALEEVKERWEGSSTASSRVRP